MPTACDLVSFLDKRRVIYRNTNITCTSRADMQQQLPASNCVNRGKSRKCGGYFLSHCTASEIGNFQIRLACAGPFEHLHPPSFIHASSRFYVCLCLIINHAVLFTLFVSKCAEKNLPRRISFSRFHVEVTSNRITYDSISFHHSIITFERIIKSCRAKCVPHVRQIISSKTILDGESSDGIIYFFNIWIFNKNKELPANRLFYLNVN